MRPPRPARPPRRPPAPRCSAASRRAVFPGRRPGTGAPCRCGPAVLGQITGSYTRRQWKETLRGRLTDAIGNASYLRQCAYLSARRLGVERIDLYYLHSGRARDASFEDQVGTLAELRQLGLIRHIGLSNVTAAQLAAARQIVDIAAVSAHFNVVAREQATLLEAALDAGAALCRGSRYH
jgi:aryl-alcohol dehydrogenase-like predicted oxidoreductase